MGSIPLDLQRRFEQRWAARFLRPAPTTPQRQLERLDQQVPPPDQIENNSAKPVDFRSAPAARARGTEASRCS
jgi:hypothetical protein